MEETTMSKRDQKPSYKNKPTNPAQAGRKEEKRLKDRLNATARYINSSIIVNGTAGSGHNPDIPFYTKDNPSIAMAHLEAKSSPGCDFGTSDRTVCNETGLLPLLEKDEGAIWKHRNLVELVNENVTIDTSVFHLDFLEWTYDFLEQPYVQNPGTHKKVIKNSKELSAADKNYAVRTAFRGKCNAYVKIPKDIISSYYRDYKNTEYLHIGGRKQRDLNPFGLYSLKTNDDLLPKFEDNIEEAYIRYRLKESRRFELVLKAAGLKRSPINLKNPSDRKYFLEVLEKRYTRK